MSRLVAQVKDKIQIGSANFAGTEWEEMLIKAIVKATNADIVAPKEKHVQNLRDHLDEHHRLIGDQLEKRLSQLKKSPAPMALKGLVLVHRLLNDGVRPFMADVMDTIHMLNFARFSDRSSTFAIVTANFLRQYALYLEEKVFVARELGHQYEIASLRYESKLATMTMEDLLKTMAELQKLMNVLLGCKIPADGEENPIIQAAMRYLTRDIIRLFKGMNEGAVKLVSEFFSLPKGQAQEALELYKRFMNQSEEVYDFINASSGSGKDGEDSMPELKRLPRTHLDEMVEYAADPSAFEKGSAEPSGYATEPAPVPQQTFDAPATQGGFASFESDPFGPSSGDWGTSSAAPQPAMPSTATPPPSLASGASPPAMPRGQSAPAATAGAPATAAAAGLFDAAPTPQPAQQGGGLEISDLLADFSSPVAPAPTQSAPAAMYGAPTFGMQNMRISGSSTPTGPVQPVGDMLAIGDAMAMRGGVPMSNLHGSPAMSSGAPSPSLLDDVGASQPAQGEVVRATRSRALSKQASGGFGDLVDNFMTR